MEARTRYHFLKNFLNALKVQSVTALTLDELQEEVKEVMETLIKDEEALKHAIAEELNFTIPETQVTDWFVSEFNAWCIQGKQLDCHGRSICKLRSSRGANQTHIQRSKELWARAQLIQHTVANYICTNEK